MFGRSDNHQPTVVVRRRCESAPPAQRRARPQPPARLRLPNLESAFDSLTWPRVYSWWELVSTKVLVSSTSCPLLETAQYSAREPVASTGLITTCCNWSVCLYRR